MAALPNSQSSAASAATASFAAALLAPLLAFGGMLPAAAADATRPVVVELFTSQGCYSCPPAEAFLGELAQRDDLIALEFHVDYWDDLVYGAAGRWKDVFSDPAYTERQRRYAQSMGSRRVYTPQMVIDGTIEEVGSRRGKVTRAIARARDQWDEAVVVRVEPGASGGLAVTIEGEAGTTSQVWLASFQRNGTTDVSAGENKGKRLVNHNVVTELRQIGEWQGQSLTLELPELRLGPNEGCAVFVQDRELGPILGAAACPHLSS